MTAPATMKVVGRGVSMLLTLVLGLGGAEAVGAQELESGGATFLSVGASGIATGEMDDRLAARGYPTFGRTALGVGIGGYLLLRGGVLLGAEWNGLIMAPDSRDGREVGLGGGYGTLGIGYVVEISPRARIYPRLGLGEGGLGLGVGSEGPVVGFDDVLENPGAEVEPDGESELTREHVVVDLGAGAEFRPGGRGGGPVIGLRFGYLLAPFVSGWRLDHQHLVSGGPAATLAGPYVRLVVGGAWSW